MKKMSSFVLFLCLAINITYGQWTTQASGVTFGLTDVHFEDTNNGYVVGTGGTILKTTNSGINWIAQTSGTSNQLNSVFFTSLSSGAVVGSAGFIAVTYNGGVNWYKQITGYTSDFRDIYFTNNMTAYVAGDAGKILKSTDGGLTWVSKPTGSTSDVFWSIWFTDANTGYAVGGNFAYSVSKILKTTDAGESWVAQTSPTTDWFYNVSFGDGNNGWAAGPNGHIAKTTNGGANWTLQNSGTSTEWLYAIYAVDSQLAFAGGGSGLILNTKDGGANWNVQPSGLPNAIRNFHFVNNSTGWAVGDGGTILKFSPASIQVNQPNGGENWKAGTLERITWASNGIANVKIEYSIDNGTNWNLIVGSTAASAGEYSWSVPNNPSTQTLVKISDAVNSSMYDQSNAVFTISAPSIILNSPNGGERWRVGSSKNITWSSGSISKIKIVYSIDNRATWKLLADSVDASLGTYSWIVPDEPTLQAVIKISAVGDSSTRDDSNAPFHIEKASLTLNTPNGGQKWKANSVQNIFWNSLLVNKIKLEYSSDNGVNWNSIVDSVLASTGNYAWTTPNINSNLCLVRISDKDDSKQADQSDSTFAIGQSSITVLSPNGGEKWKAGSNHDITWNSQFVSHVNINFSSDGGANWSAVATNISAVPGIYNGTVPILNTNNALIKITDVANSSISDQSDSTFTIYQPTLTLNSPNGGENWLAGSTKNITWSSYKVMDLRIQYTTNNGASWLNVAGPVLASSGSYSWVVPSTLTNQGKVRVIDIGDSTVQDASNGTFNIFVKSISLQQPNGGEKWKANSSQTISWITNGITNTKIEYSTNNGSSWHIINSNTSTNPTGATNSYNWVVPNLPTKIALVRVSDSADSTLKDVSNSAFEIFNPTLTLLTPNGGEKWKVGSEQDITWSSSYVAHVKIQYSTNDGINWNLITSSAPADTGTFDWLIPDSRSSQVVVKISDAADSTVTDRSDTVFSIVNPKIKLLSPVGNENIRAGSNYLIEWETVDVARVKLELTTNDGETWTTLTQTIQTPTEAKYNYNWLTPDVSSNSSKIKVTDIDDPSNYSVSDYGFTIFQSTLKVLAPNGKEAWKIGTSHNITWTSTNITTVKLEYSTNNGSTWNLIAANIAAIDGSYSWTVPTFSTNAALVKITDSDNNSVNDQSDETFFIYDRASLVLTIPNGGEKWKGGTENYIFWSSRYVANIKLEYSLDNRISWVTIVENTPAITGKYKWVLPNSPTTQAFVRISDVTDTSITDQSNSAFTIFRPEVKFSYINMAGEPMVHLEYNTGSYIEINYTSKNVDNIKLEYRRVGAGTVWKTITESYSASFPAYFWLVPNMPSGQISLRISDAADSTISDLHSGLIYIGNSNLKLTSPNGGETWKVGSTQNITWNSEEVRTVKLVYSIDNGNHWKLIANSIPASQGTFSWTMPNENSNLALVKIISENDSTVFDQSDEKFKIVRPSFTLLSPTNLEYIRHNQNYRIKWNSSGIDRIKIEYCFNDLYWTTIASDIDPTSGFYDFNFQKLYSLSVFDEPFKTDIHKIKFTDLDNPQNVVLTHFHIKQIDLLSPIGGESFSGDQLIPIKWVASEYYPNEAKPKSLQFSLDNGQNWQTFFTEQGYVKNYNENPVKESKVKPSDLGWPIYPNRELKIRFRIKDYESNLIHELSENVTAVWDQLVIVKFPTQDSVLFASQNVDVKFQLRTAPLKVNLYYSINNGSSWNLIGSDIEPTPISLAYDYKVIWQVPNITSSNCLIKISDAANENIFGISKKFSVTNVIVSNKVKINSTLTQNLLFIPESSGSKVITFKVSREFKHEGQKLIFIHPDKTDPNKSAIEEIINFPNASDTISLSAELTQAFHLKSSKIKINLLDKYNNLVSSDSITIKTKVAGKGIEIIAPTKIDRFTPNGRSFYDNIIAGGRSELIWSIKDSEISRLNIYVRSGQNVVLNIANNESIQNFVTASSGSRLLIKIPENFTFGHYDLCIADADNPTYYSYTTFNLIKPSLKVVSPNGGEIFKGDIKWSSIKISANCFDEYYMYILKNNSIVDTLLLKAYQFPDSNTVINTSRFKGKYFKIEFGARPFYRDSPCYHDSFYVDESDNYFSINPPEIQLTYPNGGEKLISKQSLNITWKSQNVDHVIINYSTDNGITWNRIAEVVASVGNYLWNIPNANSNNCLIKLSVSEDLSTNTQSSNSFSIETKRTPLLNSVLWNTSNFNFREGESPKAIVTDLTITNQLPEIHSAVVKMVSSDVDSIRRRYWLDYMPVPKISSSFNVANQKLILNGVTTIEDYKTAIQSIKFSYSGDPHKLDGEVFNTLSLQVFDGQDSSNVITRPMTFTSVNSTPVIADNSGSFLNYTIGEPPLKFVPSLSINDDVNLRGKATLEVNVVNNYIMGEDLIGSESSPIINTSFLSESAKFKMTSISGAPQVINNKAKSGLYYLVEKGAKSVGKTKKLEIQYFDDYQAASNKIIKNVTVKAPVSIAPNLRPPEEVKIAHIAGGNIRVSWKDPNGNVKGFIIYRTAAKVGKISAAALSTLADEDIIGIVEGTKSDFIDNTTSEGFNYTYRIASFDTSGVSDVSKQPPVVVNSIIKPPTNLSYKLTSYSTVQLNWEDNSEAEEGFILEAKHDTSTTFKEVIRLNKNLTSFNVYNFVYNRNYRFRVKAYNDNNTSDESNILEIKLQTTDAEKLGYIPNEFVLNQNYPNPFNPTTIISFSIPMSGFVTLRIFDILGTEITSLVREYLNPGLYSYDFDSKKYNLTSGVYVYQINYNNKTITKKFVLMK